MSNYTQQPIRVAAQIGAAAIAAAAMMILATPGQASHPTKYNKHTVTKKASFHTLKSHAKALRKAGVAKVSPIRRHGRVVGFKKTLKSGDKVIVRRAKHGRVRKTTLKRKTYLQRLKHRVSAAAKAVRHRTKLVRKALFGKRHVVRH